MPLTPFHPVIADWFRQRFGAPTDVQAKAWPAIAGGADVLIAAPTGSGKTLAAFLSAIDALFRQGLGGELRDETEVLYVSPLKALSNDVEKNLRAPLAEIGEAALSLGYLLPELRVTVRTGDTPVWDRQQMLRRPPHILVTTPESLYLLLTAEKSRRLLRTVRTVIVDEIHALAPNKRGAHLALSLERLDALTAAKPVRIGLSATQRPIETIAGFLAGAGAPPAIIDVGHCREMDLAVEVPKDELGAVATNAVWADVYDRLADLARTHRSTLVFVNTRRLAERVAHHLHDRLHREFGEEAVAAHHGSLSRRLRLSAEERLKWGSTRLVVATASLELGIDVGTVDLVCQIGSPRSIAVCLQRVGRSGHWIGAVPKGRLFPTTRDDLLECAALIRAIRTEQLDRIVVPEAPLDILAQQIVAAVATQEWREDDLYDLCRRAYPYRDLGRKEFDAMVTMLAEGIARTRGRQQAFVHHDRINRRLRPRRGTRLAAITSGGAIPDTANYAVIAEPEGAVVGSVDEDFAVESLAGDIILLGNASWRIRGIETGRMRVEDAHGAPPTIPFWRGEAPARTVELSAEVAAVRERIDVLAPADDHAAAVAWLVEACGLDRRGAEQAAAYVAEGRKVLGTVPTQRTVVAERFFDEAGGMQLVIHAPFGGRITRAWGLALRKRFCQSFDFELQAAATDEGLVLSLGERHSFPLDTVFAFLRPESLREIVTQAVLQAPMFTTRWRWNAARSLALLRFAGGKRVPPHIQRMKAEDLLAAVFPAATACQDNHRGDPYREIPDHPLVTETLRDCLTEAMDLDGLSDLLTRMASGEIRCLARETPLPSAFSHQILNANPYAFLDDAPLEERRARAVEMRRSLPPELAGELGALSPDAIAEVEDESWPVVRDADELHDALLTLVWVPETAAAPWAAWLPALLESGRAAVIQVRDTQGKARGWAAVERLGLIRTAFPNATSEPQCVSETVPSVSESPDQEQAIYVIVQGWMESLGPTTAEALAMRLSLSVVAVNAALAKLEAEGQVLRGHFRPRTIPSHVAHSRDDGGHGRDVIEAPSHSEWCNRRVLARIHRLTIGRLRKEIEPVSAAEFMQFLFQWQHVAPGSRLHGEPGLFEVIRQLAGFETAASAWESGLLGARLAKYDPASLDHLCLNGSVMWGRLALHPNLDGDASVAKRIVPTSLAPIGLFPRDDWDWLALLHDREARTQWEGRLSQAALAIRRHLAARGASFFADLVKGTGALASEVEDGLWELVAAGLVTADGFDNLRALLDPRRRRAEGRERARRPRHAAGRWSLLRPDHAGRADERPFDVARAASQLLLRYGVVFRDLLRRESLCPAWRDLLWQLRRMEARGEVRGGRFVAGFTGEQFALPSAVESLRLVRKAGSSAPGQEIRLSAADPLNLAGIILPGARVPAVPSNYVVFRDGVCVRSGTVRATGRDEGAGPATLLRAGPLR